LEAFVRSRWGRNRGGIRGLARESHVSAETIYRLFNGEGQPDLATLTQLAEALGVKRHELLAAMDGEGPVVALDEQTKAAVRQELAELLPEFLAELGVRLPPRTPRERGGAA
jgi:transcriptional regulator with XRE-family HTH domain